MKTHFSLNSLFVSGLCDSLFASLFALSACSCLCSLFLSFFLFLCVSFPSLSFSFFLSLCPPPLRTFLHKLLRANWCGAFWFVGCGQKSRMSRFGASTKTNLTRARTLHFPNRNFKERTVCLISSRTCSESHERVVRFQVAMRRGCWSANWTSRLWATNRCTSRPGPPQSLHYHPLVYRRQCCSFLWVTT